MNLIWNDNIDIPIEHHKIVLDIMQKKAKLIQAECWTGTKPKPCFVSSRTNKIKSQTFKLSFNEI